MAGWAQSLKKINRVRERIFGEGRDVVELQLCNFPTNGASALLFGDYLRFLCLFQRNAFSPEKGQQSSLGGASQPFSSIIDPESVQPRSDIFMVLGQGLDAYISRVSVAGAAFVNQFSNLR
jgi:hypothetical protein